MEHIFECDNCRAKIVTGCFDFRDTHRIYYTPPVPEIEAIEGESSDDAWKRISDWIKLSAQSYLTTLCIKCVSQ